jgi:hypothetical protein
MKCNNRSKESGLWSSCFTRYWSCPFCQALHNNNNNNNNHNNNNNNNNKFSGGICSTKSFTVWNVFDNEYPESRNKFWCVQWYPMSSWSREMVKYGYESLWTRDQKCLCWRNPAAIYPTADFCVFPIISWQKKKVRSNFLTTIEWSSSLMTMHPDRYFTHNLVS